MASVLERLQDHLAEDVLDAAPLRYELPYLNHVRTSLAENQPINKATDREVIENIYDIVVDPHDKDSKTLAALTVEVDSALSSAFTLIGFTVSRQRMSNLEAYSSADEDGAELKVMRITHQMDVI